MKALRIIAANIIGLWLADWFVAGFVVRGGWEGYIIGGILLGILALLVKPVLRFISAPVVWLTLGLFVLVINGFLIWLVARFSSYIGYTSFTVLLLATVIISLVNFIANGFKA